MRTLSRVLSPIVLVLAAGPAPHAAGQCTCTFVPGSSVTFGAAPGPLAAADLTGDGRPDLAGCDPGNNTIFVMYGAGAGTFTQPLFLPTAAGTVPGGVVTGDFDSSGRNDIAYATSAPGVAVFYRAGSGWTSPPTTYATPATPNCLIAGDLNLDGRPDVVCADSTRVHILYAVAGGLAPAVSLATALGGAVGIAIGDFNSDGRPDLVTSAVGASGSGNVTRTLLATAQGGFVLGISQTRPGAPGTPGVADFNADGRADIMIGGHSLFLGDGAGGFAVSTPSLNAGGRLDVGDFNVDGRPDLLFEGYMLLAGRGDATFAPRVDLGDGLAGFGVAIADYSTDGRPDVAIVNTTSRTVQCTLNTTPLPIAITQQPSRVFVAAGHPATFSVVASGDPLSFQWRKDSVPLTPASGYAGINTPTLMIPSAAAADSGSVFDCKISNSCYTEFTRPVALVVTAPCGSADFNGDGDLGTDADIAAFFRVLAGGGC